MGIDDWLEKQRVLLEIEREEKRIMAMSPAEIDAHIRARGDDPAEVVKRVDRIIDKAVAQFYRESGKLN